MSDDHPVQGNFDRDLADRIDTICDQFEDQWRAGKRPVIEEHLQLISRPQQRSLLTELLALEVHLRCATNDEPNITEYLQRFPTEKELVQNAFAHSATGRSPVTLLAVTQILQQQQPESLNGFLGELRQAASEQSFCDGELLIRQGEQATSLIVIRDGNVEINLRDDTGETHLIDRAGPGQLLGEMALLTDEPRTASVVAVGDVKAAVLPAEAFHRLAGDRPELSSLLSDLVADRLGKSPQDALTGKTLDRYRVRRRLGRGGMAVVYEASDMISQQRVALKMMSHRLVHSPAALERFQQEADLIERFDHPNIVKMHRRFAAFHTYFIVMEYCAGDTLANRLHDFGSMSEPLFRRSLGQLAAALSYAHEQGIVHRDIKPANIMYLPSEEMKLMDFGLAEPIIAPNRAGDVAGTPRYMSPEQRVGGLVGQRSDYFSLGCVAYEMLTGLPLFDRSANREISRDFSAWQPTELKNLDGQISASSASVVRSLLQREPELRDIDLETIANWAKHG